jgi:hypothetical protein
MFDNYPTPDIGDDNMINLCLNFKEYVIGDQNILEVFRSEIKSILESNILY